ncbi:Saccharopine dehydrogenase [Variovorax sp. PBS-H4]|uniref:saccharopine dehydrogenase NADP-binding domain-containing protein n=1 Tax=Variovorax sp. PBS-H4 TaxID=434008 RepID=UPI0013187151|nr:saccharopine dehydrogenase NADP-binding domain-containing protein [Variovorax sp. PBS-H4]VTU21867.1 Saccharopine dehydrogenase [Variovorax sp. PBS-H4]
MKILILGGYGNFGARICRALASDPDIELLVAGRDAGKASDLTRELGPRATALALDLRTAELAGQFAALGVNLVIHAAGPFQEQGYGVAMAAAEARAHYLDLADGRRFVCDFPSALDTAFRHAGRTGISGASTVPALSSAVIDALCVGWKRIHNIDICIAPAQTAPRGDATLAGVLSYCGEEVTVWLEGRWQTRRGWAHLHRERFARLRSRLGALCDIPDLELFPSLYGVRDRVMFRAAVEVGMSQRILALMAALRAAKLIPQPARWASALNRAGQIFNAFGSRLGGMVVRVSGCDGDGRDTTAAWHIAADDDHGPEIPCMAAILLARRLARGAALPVGAFTAARYLTLQDFAPEFARWGMRTDKEEGGADATE